LTQNFPAELHLEWEGQLSDFVTAWTYSPNGSAWAASSASGEVIWNAGLTESIFLNRAEDRFFTPAPPSSIETVAFSADSCWLAAGGQSRQLLIWHCDPTNSLPQLVRKIDYNKWIDRLVWHPTKPHLAIGYGSQVQIWDAITATDLANCKFDRATIFDLAWHPAGSYLAISGYKGIQLWSPQAQTVPTHRIDVDTASLSIAWSRNGRYLAAGNLDRTITIVDMQNPTDPWILQGCPGKIRQLTWIAGTDTECLAVASGTVLVLWNLTPDETTWNGRLLEGHQAAISTLTAHPHLSIVASGGKDGYGCLWSAPGQIERVLSSNDLSPLSTLAWHPDGTYLATGNQNGEMRLWTIPA
jgi:WD40 repeat protein